MTLPRCVSVNWTFREKEVRSIDLQSVTTKDLYVCEGDRQCMFHENCSEHAVCVHICKTCTVVLHDVKVLRKMSSFKPVKCLVDERVVMLSTCNRIFFSLNDSIDPYILQIPRAFKYIYVKVTWCEIFLTYTPRMVIKDIRQTPMSWGIGRQHAHVGFLLLLIYKKKKTLMLRRGINIFIN